MLFLEVQQGSQTSLRVVRGKVGVPFESLQGNQVLSLVKVALSVLSTCSRKLSVPPELQ